jgi:hypothetical protein
LDPVKFLENIKEVVEVFDSNLINTKVINNETELDETPFVVPETRGGFSFIVTFSKKAGSEEIVGQNAGLGKAIAALDNFEVDPTVMVSTRKLVLLNEFCWDVCDFDVDILRGRALGGINVEFLRLMELKCTPLREITLLSSNLKSSRDVVLVPTSPG